MKASFVRVVHFDALVLPGARKHIAASGPVGELLDFFFSDLQIVEVNFIASNAEACLANSTDFLWCVVFDGLVPVAQAKQRALVGHVANQQNALRISEEHRRHALEPFLPSGVPDLVNCSYLQVVIFSVDHHLFREEH